MLFIAFTLAQCFYQRNLKPQMRKLINSLIALTHQLYTGLGDASAKDTAVHSGAGPP